MGWLARLWSCFDLRRVFLLQKRVEVYSGCVPLKKGSRKKCIDY